MYVLGGGRGKFTKMFTLFSFQTNKEEKSLSWLLWGQNLSVTSRNIFYSWVSVFFSVTVCLSLPYVCLSLVHHFSVLILEG